MSAGPRRAGSALLALLSLAVLVGSVFAAPASAALVRQADEDDAGAAGAPADPFDALAECVVENGRLLVVLLVDESASLRETDPDDQRVVGARTALQSIDRLRGTDAEGSEVEIDVLVSTFSNEFSPVGEWTRLDEGTAPAVDRTIAALADRDESMDTDFHNALVGARDAIDARAAEADGETCRTVLLFTDGSFTLGARETPEQQERFGTTKPYAPGVELTTQEAVDQATSLGVDALCDPGGVADSVRDDRITLVSVALGEGSDLLEAITTGTGTGGTTCGDPATDRPGVYLTVADTDDILSTFDLVASQIAGGDVEVEDDAVVPCEDAPCEEGAVEFTVDRDLRGVRILATGPAADVQVVLEPPEGEPLRIAAGEDVDGEVGGLPVVATWPADRTVALDLEVPDDGTGEGEWRVVLIGRSGEEPGRIQVVTLERGVDQAKRLVLAIALMAAGLLLPLALLVVINLATTRFQDLSTVRGARIPVVVAGHGQVLRTDGGLHVLRLPETDFEDLEGLGEGRSFTWRGLVFQATTPLNPFAEPHARVAPEGGTAKVAKEGRRTDLALGLAGSWMFLLDQDATRASEREDEIHGQLVAFVAAGSEAAQTHRLITDVEARLPATARRLARIADVRGRGGAQG